MKIAEAWRLSTIPYREVVYQSLAEEKGRMWWGAFGRNQAGKESQNDLELTRRALRIAKFDKAIVSAFNILVSIAPFAAPFLGISVFGLASSISLSLTVTFGLTTLYAIQTLSSFVDNQSSALMSTLPVTKDDFSLITLFSFIRSVDYMVAGSILSQVVTVALVTMNPLATLAMLVAATINQVFAVTIALWFSRIFQKSLLRGGRSKSNTILRLVFISMWGVLLVGVGFLFSMLLYIVPNLENVLIGVSQTSNLLIGLLYPFSTAILIGSISYSKIALTTILASSAAIVASALLAILAAKWSLKIVKSISQSSGLKIARAATKDFSIKIHRPLTGYIQKDLKVTSKNPATAFFFALPVLETAIITLLISNLEVLRTSLILVGTSMGAVFALFMPLALLTAEGKGLNYTKTLPISARKIIISKTIVTTATYILVPIVLTGVAYIKTLTSPYAILIPFLITMSVASASIFEIKIFLRTTAKNKIAAVINDLEKIVVGLLTVIAPQIVYSIVFLLTYNHGISILSTGITALAELAVAAQLLKHA